MAKIPRIKNRIGRGVSSPPLIPLTQGMYALVDTFDLSKVLEFNWYAKKGKKTHYAKTKIKGKTYNMSWIILGLKPKKGQVIDHKDGNGLNNQRSNLRVCTVLQNNLNKPKRKSKCSSTFKGVYWSKSKSKWRAYISLNGRRIWLGYFSSEADAALAYNQAAVRYFKQFACINEVGCNSE